MLVDLKCDADLVFSDSWELALCVFPSLSCSAIISDSIHQLRVTNAVPGKVDLELDISKDHTVSRASINLCKSIKKC
jgi:hypothetical protein